MNSEAAGSSSPALPGPQLLVFMSLGNLLPLNVGLDLATHLKLIEYGKRGTTSEIKLQKTDFLLVVSHLLSLSPQLCSYLNLF